ncbi:MAG: hypothetical protein L6265_08890 [Thermoplasmatales archaeon]|nr:hypothetical protein [Thermoplasmatales archaeon]
MKAAERVKHLAWKAVRKNKISDIRNKRRGKAAQVKWMRESMAWGHKHPKR